MANEITKKNIISIMNGIELGYNLTYPSSIELLEKMIIFRDLKGAQTDLLEKVLKCDPN